MVVAAPRDLATSQVVTETEVREWTDAFDLSFGIDSRGGSHPWLAPWRYLALGHDTAVVPVTEARGMAALRADRSAIAQATACSNAVAGPGRDTENTTSDNDQSGSSRVRRMRNGSSPGR